jgi:hypothetical protein
MKGTIMKTFEIREDLAQAVVNYLAERPYKEVRLLVTGMMSLKPIEEPKEPLKEEEIKA